MDSHIAGGNVYKSFDVGAMPLEGMLGREWLVTNGIGGYASSTVPCLNTRKYHGLLVAAMTPPVRRMVLLSRVEDTLFSDGWPHALSTNEYPGTFHPDGYHALRAFSPDPFPRWAYQGENWTLQKELCLLRDQNTVCLTYTLLAGGRRPVALELRPLLALRPIHELSFQWNGKLGAETRDRSSQRVPATTRTPEVFFSHTGEFEHQPNWYLNTIYRKEQERGYPGLEDVWSPGPIRFSLTAGQSAHFVCSADPIDLQAAIEQAHRHGATTSKCVTVSAPLGAPATPEVVDQLLDSTRAAAAAAPAAVAQPTCTAEEEVLGDLTRATEQFIVHGTSNGDGAGEIRPAGAIGQYPWSPPSARAALAGFAGLFLVTGRPCEGRSLLLSMVPRLDRGLLPPEFPEDGTSPPTYNGADVSLWFVNAVGAYLRYTGDEASINASLFEAVLQIVEHYRRGTRLGISADGEGLLRTYAPGMPTTWMDAKVGDWVITPRQGRPVEVNALWYNAVCVAADLAGRFGHGATAESLSAFARQIKQAFNERFWNPAGRCCYDVITDRGPDPALRPNQLLAMSLPFPVLSPDRHAPALDRVIRELRTPVGVRSLSQHDPAYCGRCAGNVIARERASHNGSAYAWLLGPLVTAYLRVHGRGQGARREAAELLQGCLTHLRGDGLGQIPELFDGDAPHTPGGAIASAVGVAEVLRAYYEDVLDRAPARAGTPPVEPGFNSIVQARAGLPGDR